MSKQHTLDYLYDYYGHKNPIISRLYHAAHEKTHDDDDDKTRIERLTYAAQHVYRQHRYMENTISKPPVALFPGWNIPPRVSAQHFILSMIQVARAEIPISKKDENDIYASMLAPFEK